MKYIGIDKEKRVAEKTMMSVLNDGLHIWGTAAIPKIIWFRNNREQIYNIHKNYFNRRFNRDNQYVFDDIPYDRCDIHNCTKLPFSASEIVAICFQYRQKKTQEKSVRRDKGINMAGSIAQSLASAIIRNGLVFTASQGPFDSEYNKELGLNDEWECMYVFGIGYAIESESAMPIFGDGSEYKFDTADLIDIR
jgi:hypothetical protein